MSPDEDNQAKSQDFSENAVNESSSIKQFVLNYHIIYKYINILAYKYIFAYLKDVCEKASFQVGIFLASSSPSVGGTLPLDGFLKLGFLKVGFLNDGGTLLPSLLLLLVIFFGATPRLENGFVLPCPDAIVWFPCFDFHFN